LVSWTAGGIYTRSVNNLHALPGFKRNLRRVNTPNPGFSWLGEPNRVGPNPNVAGILWGPWNRDDNREHIPEIAHESPGSSQNPGCSRHAFGLS
jgi:hypothetical protein